MENELIVTKIHSVMTDGLEPDRPFVPAFPRKYGALAYVLEGSLRYTVEERETVIRAGEVVFIAPGHLDLAEAFACDRVRYITVDFSALHPENVLDTRIRLRNTEEILALFRQLEQCWLGGSYQRMMKCMALFYTLLNAILENKASPGDSGLLYKHSRIAPTVSYIHTHYQDPGISVAALAKEAGMSEVHLNRLFRELYGMTVGAYVQQTRLRYAKYLLANSTTQVQEVALAAGYLDIYTFSHAFKRATGLSPSEWRQRK